MWWWLRDYGQKHGTCGDPEQRKVGSGEWQESGVREVGWMGPRVSLPRHSPTGEKGMSREEQDKKEEGPFRGTGWQPKSDRGHVGPCHPCNHLDQRGNRTVRNV